MYCLLRNCIEITTGIKVPPHCAMKVDIMKVYDMIYWDFLWSSLRSMLFSQPVPAVDRSMYFHYQFSTNINGEFCGFFKAERELRQGDLISLYLFMLAMEVFSRLLRKAMEHMNFWFHWRCKNLKISHLSFSDNLLIFCKGNLEPVLLLKDCLFRFQAISVLMLNPHKSWLFTCGVPSAPRANIISVMGFGEGILLVQFLGVPLISTKLKKIDSKDLVEKITARAKSWTSKFLSFVGRLQSIMFILPKSFIKEVERVLRTFFWNGSNLNLGGAKVA